MTEPFNDHQWQRLVDAGPQIALAVAASSGSPKQSVEELDAFLRMVDQAADDSDGGGVLARLALDTRSKLAAGMLRGNQDEAIPDGIHAAREAGAILAVHADEQEARALRQWLLSVAYTVASAARDGGVLGIGSREVSELEQETMNAITDALGATMDSDDGPDSAAPTEAETDAANEELSGASTGPGVGPDGQPIGPDNIREGRVRGSMGGPNQTQGEGQGG
ncbi:MAG: hypothetical protein ACR2H0_05500 [Candidatus Limnocylindrales bacterium]